MTPMPINKSITQRMTLEEIRDAYTGDECEQKPAELLLQHLFLHLNEMQAQVAVAQQQVERLQSHYKLANDAAVKHAWNLSERKNDVAMLRDALRKLKDAADFLLVGIAARNRRDASDEARMKDITGPLVEAVSAARDKANAALSQITVIPETNSSTPNDVLEDTKRLNLLETFGSPTAHGTMLWCVEGAIEKADLRDAIDNLPEAKR